MYFIIQPLLKTSDRRICNRSEALHRPLLPVHARLSLDEDFIGLLILYFVEFLENVGSFVESRRLVVPGLTPPATQGLVSS